MRNKQWILIVAIFGLCGSIVNAEEFIGSLQIAKSNFSINESGSPDYDAGKSLILRGSKSMEKTLGLTGFFFEGEFSKSIIAAGIEESVNSNGAKITSRIAFNYWSAGAYGAYVYPVTDKLSLKGRLGYVYTNLSVTSGDACSGNASTCTAISGLLLKEETDGDSGTGIAYGVSISYAFADDKSIVIEYTKMNAKYEEGRDEKLDTSITHIGIGVEFIF